MRDLPLAHAYRRHGFGLGGVLLKQSLYPGHELFRLLDGARLVLDYGCGEGLLTHLLARAHPRCRFRGIDLNSQKVAAAQSCQSTPNVEFQAGSFFDDQTNGADAVIFNDVLHHLPPERQLAALRHAAQRLNESGVLLLKEVDSHDKWDVRHTTFWDRRLYPADSLAFSTPDEWTRRLAELGFRRICNQRVRHPWVASRTLLAFTRRPKLAEFIVQHPSENTTESSPAILVTGATGFIGEWVVRDLLRQGLDGQPVRVDIVVRNPARLAPDLRSHPQIRILQGDLCAPEFLQSAAPNRYLAVIHLAAAVDYFGGNEVFQNNLQATKGLLQACAQISPARFIYISTMGAVDRARWDTCAKPLDENSPSHPTSPYGRAKYAEELEVRASKLDWTIIRIPWCYGPGMADSHHVRNLLQRVRRNALVCRLNWPGRVSVIEVSEASAQIIATIGRGATSRKLFYLADPAPIRIGELFAEMGRTVGIPTAGSINFPRWLWGIGRIALPVLPFQLKCLLADALTVSPKNATDLGISVRSRTAGFLLPLARYDANQRFPQRHHAHALVTGAGSGIGACLVRQLSAQGYALILADRDASALSRTKTDLPSALTWVVDLASPQLSENLSAMFPASFPWPSVVINNAGMGWRGSVWEMKPADLDRVLAVNAWAPAVLCRFFLSTESAPTTIVNITSTAALQPLPHMAVYAAAKSFLLSFSLSLDAEARAQARLTRILTVIPGGTQTNFQASAGVGTNPREKLLSPAEVSAQILRGVERKWSVLYIGSRARVMRIAACVLPLARQAAIWEKLMRKLR